MERVMVVCAHPDDEILGCGATMAKHIESGDEVHVLIMADGVSSRDAVNQDYVERNESATKASEIIGHTITQLQYADNQMDKYPQLQVAKSIESEIEKYRPTIVYTHWPHDMNVDHRVTSKATSVACRPVPGCSVKRLFYFEVPSSTEWCSTGQVFSPNWFSSVHITKKLDALNCYSMEMRESPHPRSVESVINLMKLRGCEAGVQYAEAFIMARGIA